MKRPIRTFECTHCGKPVRENARACPHCGSDDETGWGSHDDDAYEDDFDYDEFVSREFPARPSQNAKEVWRRRVLWTIVILFFASMFLGFLPSLTGKVVLPN